MKKGYMTTSDNARIYYEDRGEGMPLLFVPGHMCTSRFFDKNAGALSEEFRVVVMDPRGFGNSSKVLYGNSVDRGCDDIKELIEYLGLDQVVLLGWSMGGSMVMMYAHKYAEAHLKAIVLIDCALFPFSPEPWNEYSARGYNMDDWCEKYKNWFLHAEVYYDNFMKRIERGLTAEEYAVLRREIEKTSPWIGFAVHTDWCHTDTEQYLRELTIPALIMAGEAAGMCRHYCEQLNTYQEFQEFEEGGHALFLAESSRFNRYLMEFIKRIEKSKGRRFLSAKEVHRNENHIA